jgi:dTDP-4-amino-4,6-dideoxygalactose transaminase
METIPFNHPYITGIEAEYVSQALKIGKLSGDGAFTRKCSELLENELGVPRVLLTTSCTHALDMAAILLDIHPGDEVIIPSFTFVSTVNAFALRGAKPVFADIRPDTLNLDETKLTSLITPRTKAIVPVHYAGVGCEMDKIQALAAKHNLAIVEDNAHGLFGKYKEKPLGTFGCMATQSFHETKNFTSGEGGALLINDPVLVERAEIIREKGTNRSRFFRGQVDKYTWVDIGSSYLPSEILAAFLLAQLENRQYIQQRRKRIWEYYDNHLMEWAADNGIRLPIIPVECEQSYHMYYMLLPDLSDRQAFIQHMKDHGIMTPFHYIPLHNSPMGESFGGKTGDCPVTEEISDRLVRLPFFVDLNEEQLAYIVSCIQKFRPGSGK